MTNRDRVPTGITGMDELISSGFSDRSVNVVSGPAGSGKSLMSMHYIYNGAAKYGDTGIYLTLEENRENIVKAMTSYGMDIERLEDEKKFYLLDMSAIRRKCSEDMEEDMVGFQALQKLLENLLNYSGAKRLAVDSLTAIGLYYNEASGILRRELFRFGAFLKEKNVTSLLITESLENGELTRYGIEQFVGDSFITMGLEEMKGELRRTITVRKMRFTKHDTAKHPLLITPQGMQISPEAKVF